MTPEANPPARPAAGRFPLPMTCNQCGECCRQGGVCALRRRSWSRCDEPAEFAGRCRFLSDSNRCLVMEGVEAAHGSLAELRRYFTVVGACDFPHLRAG